VRENAVAAGIRLEPAVMKKIDKALGKVGERDPALTNVPEGRYA